MPSAPRATMANPSKLSTVKGAANVSSSSTRPSLSPVVPMSLTDARTPLCGQCVLAADCPTYAEIRMKAEG